MRFYQLGKNGPKVSSVGYGCMGLSAFYGKPTGRQEAMNLIRAAYNEYEVNFFDTADMYGTWEGENEELVAESIKSFRDKIVIATKCAISFDGTDYTVNNRPEYIKKSCEKSLKRLGVDEIDLYYLHRRNFDTPIEDAAQAMLDLVNEGKIKYVGFSEIIASELENAYSILGDKLVAVQSECSFRNRASLQTIVPTCRKLGIAFVAYSPIARGFLSGSFRDPKFFGSEGYFDFRAQLPQFQPDAYEQNLALVDSIDSVAQQIGCTTAQLSLAWLKAQGDDIIPIPGTSNMDHLRDNVNAMSITLSSENLRTLEESYNSNPQAGKRYPQELLELFKLAA